MTVFHPCAFNFEDTDIRVAGTTLSGGTSLTGIEDVVETSGGGFWVADFSGADFGGPDGDDRSVTLAWRALGVAFSGGRVGDVIFCDAFHQPVLTGSDVPHSDGSPFSDDTPYQSGGASASVLAVNNGQSGGLNCTSLDIAIVSERPLIGGERFTLVHPTWGARAYEIGTVIDVAGGKRVTFIPPVRGGVVAGEGVDFDNVRCRMRRVSEASNQMSLGLYGSGAITFQEDMRPPEDEA